jgi:hypothetical protein
VNGSRFVPPSGEWFSVIASLVLLRPVLLITRLGDLSRVPTVDGQKSHKCVSPAGHTSSHLFEDTAKEWPNSGGLALKPDGLYFAENSQHVGPRTSSVHIESLAD